MHLSDGCLWWAAVSVSWGLIVSSLPHCLSFDGEECKGRKTIVYSKAKAWSMLAFVLRCFNHVLFFCNPMACSPPISLSVGILQARILEWVAMPFSRGPSRPRDRAHVSYVSCTYKQVLYHWYHLWPQSMVHLPLNESSRGWTGACPKGACQRVVPAVARSWMCISGQEDRCTCHPREQVEKLVLH